jgi:GAF domain-containing protein
MPTPETVARAVAAARAAFGTRRVALFWAEPGSGRLACVATDAAAGGEGWIGETLAAGVGMAGRAVAEGRAAWTPDLLADPGVPVAPWLRERLEREGLRVVAAAPVRIGGEVRGALGFLDPAGRTFSDADLRRIAELADEVARSLGPPAGQRGRDSGS